MSKGAAIRILQAIALVAAGAWLLAGCGEVTGVNEEHGWNGTMTEVPFTLDDGRKITCVTFEGNGGAGLSCDWGGDG